MPSKRRTRASIISFATKSSRWKARDQNPLARSLNSLPRNPDSPRSVLPSIAGCLGNYSLSEDKEKATAIKLGKIEGISSFIDI